MKKTDRKRLAGSVLVLVMLLSAAGCGGGTAAGSVPDAIPETTSEAVEDGGQAPSAADTESPPGTPESQDGDGQGAVTDYAGLLDRVRRAEGSLGTGGPAPGVESADVGGAGAEDMASVGSVARLAELYSVAKKLWLPKDYVDVDDDHNPYDYVWTYGSRHLEGDDAFGNLYASYVEACDWSLVFDAEYYKSAFPVLAHLYHGDGALLLEHFQTVGVREGRQGCTGFNVSAYMANCRGELSGAFGDASVCYYFYYMLNHAAEGSVGTDDPDGRYPLWRSVELTCAQQWELDAVNAYRAEVGAAPVVPDPELMALANYRAWANAEYRYRAHDWVDDHQDECVELMDMLGTDGWSENMVVYYRSATADTKMADYADAYRDSEDHYKAMVNGKFHWFGVAHVYRHLGAEGYVNTFDVFSADASKTSCIED